MNTLTSGDRVLMVETGHFATLWKGVAARLGLDPVLLPGDWRRGVDAAQVGARLADDRAHAVKAVCVVHNETSTGVTSDVAAVRRALDAARHPALLIVDTVSSLASIDYRHDEWGVDVTVGASQKGLMLPPGLSFNVASDKALAAHAGAGLPRSYWDWGPLRAADEQGVFLTPRRPTSSSACARRWPCCRPKDSTTCSPGTIVTPRPRGVPCGHGVSSCSVSIPPSTALC